jgi:hypothetical protein
MKDDARNHERDGMGTYILLLSSGVLLYGCSSVPCAKWPVACVLWKRYQFPGVVQTLNRSM